MDKNRYQEIRAKARAKIDRKVVEGVEPKKDEDRGLIVFESVESLLAAMRKGA
jgi:hypothetical protein